MSHYYENVRPLVCPQVGRYRGYGRVADVIPLYPRLHAPRPWRAVAFALAAAIVIATSLAFMLRAANETMGQLIPVGWW